MRSNEIAIELLLLATRPTIPTRHIENAHSNVNTEFEENEEAGENFNIIQLDEDKRKKISRTS